jgi:hypothetical protein
VHPTSGVTKINQDETDRPCGTCKEQERYKAWAGIPEDNDPLNDLHRDVILFKWILKKQNRGRGINWVIQLKMGTCDGLL